MVNIHGVSEEYKKDKVVKRQRLVFTKGWRWYGGKYYLYHPWELFRQLWQEIYVMFERGIYGYARKDTWNLGDYHIKLLVESLKYFKENLHGYPAQLTEKQWDDILNQIVAELEYYTTQEFFDLWGDEVDEAMKRFKKTWTLLGKWIFNMWD